ncbi:alkane 1-monooxygenase [Actinomadura parmotrematis]|uniref:Alkane 1-monooxygenase n=1 Tax=Actinomadura parmotrematis TaxID=2864039 RepID=A0ABS7FLT2_9ACTN|nr:alkane 1-monooxygenase [Actinomadura parmotrematis]MBW8481333.1 alkane 1-monooxygenase [Actinomadura parmotrematis]
MRPLTAENAQPPANENAKLPAAENDKLPDTAVAGGGIGRDGPAGVAWTDRKKYLWLLGLAIPLAPLVAWGLVTATGWGGFWYLGPFLFGVVNPLLDLLLGKDSSNPPESVLSWLEEQRYYRWCTYAYLPLQYAGLVLACWMWSRGDVALWEKVGLMLTMGVVGGIAINTAHELGHKKDVLERRLSKVALAQTAYGHFYIEHNRGHHVRVATPEDPASARLGESFYRFLPRTVWGSLRSAWRLEKARLARSGKGPWTVRNDVLNAWALTVALYASLIAAFGIGIVPFLVVQAVIGFSALEVVNYLEHYGLLRERTPAGRYERCAPRHSWNSNSIASNIMLYHLQRHSDHHANPTRRFQALRHFDEAPELPSGYATLARLATVPPLWRLVMDKRVIAHYGGDASRANIQPGKHARYGVTPPAASGETPA